MLVKGLLIMNIVRVSMGRATEVRTIRTCIGPCVLDTLKEPVDVDWYENGTVSIIIIVRYTNSWYSSPSSLKTFAHENHISLCILSLIDSRLSMQNMTAIDIQTRIPCMRRRSKSLKFSSRGLFIKHSCWPTVFGNDKWLSLRWLHMNVM